MCPNHYGKGKVFFNWPCVPLSVNIDSIGAHLINNYAGVKLNGENDRAKECVRVCKSACERERDGENEKNNTINFEYHIPETAVQTSWIFFAITIEEIQGFFEFYILYEKIKW